MISAEIEENNRMGKTRDLFKNIRDTKGTFHAKMGTIRQKRYGPNKNKVLRRGGKNTQNYTIKELNDPDNHDGVITHLEPDILESIVKWALGSITTNKASGGDRIPTELFQVLKGDAVKILHSICQQIWKTVATGLEKVSFHSNPKERECRRMFKLPYNCTHLTR